MDLEKIDLRPTFRNPEVHVELLEALDQSEHAIVHH